MGRMRITEFLGEQLAGSREHSATAYSHLSRVTTGVDVAVATAPLLVKRSNSQSNRSVSIVRTAMQEHETQSWLGNRS